MKVELNGVPTVKRVIIFSFYLYYNECVFFNANLGMMIFFRPMVLGMKIFILFLRGDNMKYNGAEIVVKLLENQGVEYIAGIPRGFNLPIYDALYYSKITHILARHEQGAAFL